MLRDIDIPQHSKLWQTSFTFQAPDYMAKGWYWTEFFFWAWTCKFWSQFLLSFHLVQNFSNFDENNKFQIFEWQIRRNEIKVKDERQPNLLSTIIEFLVYVFFSHKKNKNLLFCSRSWRSTQQCRGMPGKYGTLSNENLTSFAHQKIPVFLVTEYFVQVLWMPGS